MFKICISLVYIYFIIFIIFRSDKYSYSFVKPNYKNKMYNFKCIKGSNNHIKLKYYFVRLKYKTDIHIVPVKFNLNNTLPKFTYQFQSILPSMKEYIKVFIFRNVIISDSGSVHSNLYNLRLADGCRCNSLSSAIPKFIKNYKRVLVLSQYWGNTTFHALIECLTKVSFFLKEIRSESLILHIGNNSAINNYLKLLEINTNFTITGYIKTQYAYIVQNSKCGRSAGILPLRYLKDELTKRNIFYNRSQKIILYIKRLYSRSIYNDLYFINILVHTFKNYSVKVFFPYTSFNDTLLLFGTAKYVFAPHGAGLSNIILCHQNVIIVEFLIYPIVNLCYSSLSLSLGYKYYGIYQHYDGYKFILNISFFNEYLIREILTSSNI